MIIAPLAFAENFGVKGTVAAASLTCGDPTTSRVATPSRSASSEIRRRGRRGARCILRSLICGALFVPFHC
ncbi:hypothetical protein GCM10009798_35410 [Nocardioides panacihumi]|uniref:Uncharacterized protein n=1 Tax=Nocardioides panacihumi TaxID=400774 RepID=A0ABN2RMS5_9ACTN